MPGGRTKRLSPEGTALLPKSLSCVKRYSGFKKHRLELHLIRPLLMMLRLMFDVTHHNGLVRTTHAEGSVPFLPCELQSRAHAATARNWLSVPESLWRGRHLPEV